MDKTERARASHLRLKFGITPEQYEELLEKQGHACAICGRDKSLFKVRLAVDHNHVTGEIRGLACTYCNRRLIGRHRDASLLRKIADYIDQGTGWFVPPRKRPQRRPTKKRPNKATL